MGWGRSEGNYKEEWIVGLTYPLTSASTMNGQPCIELWPSKHFLVFYRPSPVVLPWAREASRSEGSLNKYTALPTFLPFIYFIFYFIFGSTGVRTQGFPLLDRCIPPAPASFL
jgi:hypothetical protein